jgi:hypothetical protein
MENDFEAYVSKRIHELSNNKNKIFNLLQTVNKSVHELDLSEKREVLELKQEFYLISGALAELEELSKKYKEF